MKVWVRFDRLIILGSGESPEKKRGSAEEVAKTAAQWKADQEWKVGDKCLVSPPFEDNTGANAQYAEIVSFAVANKGVWVRFRNGEQLCADWSRISKDYDEL